MNYCNGITLCYDIHATYKQVLLNRDYQNQTIITRVRIGRKPSPILRFDK